MTQRIRKAHGSVDDTEQARDPREALPAHGRNPPRGLGPVSARALVPHSQTPTGGDLACQIIINIILYSKPQISAFQV